MTSPSDPPPTGPDPAPDHQAARIFFLPNLMTAGNLFCGFVAIIRCIQARQYELRAEIFRTYGSALPAEATAQVATFLQRANDFYTQAVWLLFAAVIFDSLDGRLARLGGRESLFGKEFDSLADVVSFGVAPALMMFFLILSPAQGFPWFQQIGWFFGFVYLVCGAVRLARFNVLTRPNQAVVTVARRDPFARDFLGLPIPAAAGAVASLVLLVLEHDLEKWAILLPGFAFVVSLLMVSTVRYPSFKQVDWSLRTRFTTFVFALVGVGTVVLLKEIALVLLFTTYLGYGLVRHIRLKLRRSADMRLRRTAPQQPVNKP